MNPNNYFQFIEGRLTRDPEVIYTPSQKAICNLTIAVDHWVKDGDEWVNKPDFPRVTVFGEEAEKLEKQSAKGLRVNVFGRIATKSWQDANGKTVYATDLIAERVKPIDKKDKGIKVDYKESSDPVPEFKDIDADIPF